MRRTITLGRWLQFSLEIGSKFNYGPAPLVCYTIIVSNLLTVRILIGAFKVYSELLYEAHLRPMMVNIHTFGIYMHMYAYICKQTVQELG